jgi:hypothetical protein
MALVGVSWIVSLSRIRLGHGTANRAASLGEAKFVSTGATN